ncbi:MAG: PAS domain-containing protein [Balneolaceae bacterium]|nr:PAS domain-containing protein [Balneolaceae bacterium]
MDLQNKTDDKYLSYLGMDLFKMLADSDSDLIALHYADGTYKYVSKAFTKTLGYEIDDLVGKNPYDFFHQNDAEKIEAHHKKALSGDFNSRIEYRFRNSDEKYVWLETKTLPIKDDDGDLLFLQTRSRLIDEKKKKDLLLQRARKMTMVGAWEFDLRSEELFWSDEVYQIYDLSKDVKITVEKAFSYFPQESVDILSEAFSNAIVNGESYDLSIQFVSEKNNPKWVRAIGAPEYEDGEVIKVSGAFQDITELKRLEILFRESQKMANVGGWEYDIVSGDLFWSDEVYRIHELEIGTPVKVEDGISYYPEGFSRDSITKAINHAMETGEGWDVELPFVTAKGRELWVRAKGSVEFAGGKPVKMRGTFQDLTEQHNLLNQVQKEKQFSEKLASTGPMAMYIYDFSKEHVSFINNSYENILGYSYADINAMTNEEHYGLIHNDDIPDMIERFVCLQEDKIDQTIEYRMKHKDGHWVWCYSINTPFELDSEGKVKSYIGMFHDITQKKEMEEELIKARDIADQANKAKSQFLANMSHEIRTPMNSILGFTDLLSNKIQEEENVRYLTNISNSGKLLLKLINDILDISKIEAGAVDQVLEPVNVERTLQEIKGVFDLKAKEKNLEFNLTTPKNLPNALLLDEKHLRQVIFNLVGNAIKFTNAGSIDLDVKFTDSNDVESKVDLEISVTDTGIGIKPEQTKKIFQAFEQQGRVIADEFGGTGLGLSICRKLIELMDGDISIKSEHGIGSCFTVTIPNVVISTIKSKKDNYRNNNFKFNLKPSKVLIADDVENNRELLAECLKDQPIEITMAVNGEEAIEMARKEDFDLLLLDIKMPKVDGIEVMRVLRAEKFENKILALTASGMIGYEKEVLNEGFDDFLRKPISYDELLSTLHYHLGGDVDKKPEIFKPVPVKTVKHSSISKFDLTRLKDNGFEELYAKYCLLDKDALMMDSCEEFAKILKKAGESIKSKWCIDLATEMDFAAKTFDTEKVIKEITKFEDVITRMGVDTISVEAKK